MKNPFEFGRELGIEELVDREDEVASVLNTIREGNKLFLIGRKDGESHWRYSPRWSALSSLLA